MPVEMIKPCKHGLLLESLKRPFSKQLGLFGFQNNKFVSKLFFFLQKFT